MQDVELPKPADIETRAQAAGLSIADVCKRADIALSTFYRWKAGKTAPTLTICQRLLDATKKEAA